MQDRKDTPVDGIPWGDGTICNVRWGGVCLRSLLLSTGLPGGVSSNQLEGLYVCFASHVTACEDDSWFGGSLPLEEVLDAAGDALLAYEVRARKTWIRLILLKSAWV